MLMRHEPEKPARDAWTYYLPSIDEILVSLLCVISTIVFTSAMILTRFNPPAADTDAARALYDTDH